MKTSRKHLALRVMGFFFTTYQPGQSTPRSLSVVCTCMFMWTAWCNWNVHFLVLLLIFPPSTAGWPHQAAPLYKRREQATVVPAHSASVFAVYNKCPSACKLCGQGSDVKQSWSNQPSPLNSINTLSHYSFFRELCLRSLIVCGGYDPIIDCIYTCRR